MTSTSGRSRPPRASLSLCTSSRRSETDDFRPWIRLWSPTGASLGDTSGLAAADINVGSAPVTGTYLVLVASFDSGLDGTGTYGLTVTSANGRPVASAGADQSVNPGVPCN